MERLIEIYRKWAGKEPKNVTRMQGAGSNREYYRITADDGTTVVGVVGTSRDENHAFIYLSNHFSADRKSTRLNSSHTS